MDKASKRIITAVKFGVKAAYIAKESGITQFRISSIAKAGEDSPYRSVSRLTDEEQAEVNRVIGQIKAAL